MANPPKVILKIVSLKGTCGAGHKVGQEFDLSKEFTVGFREDGKALCPSGFHAAFPSWRVLRFGGKFPWARGTPLNKLFHETIIFLPHYGLPSSHCITNPR